MKIRIIRLNTIAPDMLTSPECVIAERKKEKLGIEKILRLSRFRHFDPLSSDGSPFYLGTGLYRFAISRWFAVCTPTISKKQSNRPQRLHAGRSRSHRVNRIESSVIAQQSSAPFARILFLGPKSPTSPVSSWFAANGCADTKDLPPTSSHFLYHIKNDSRLGCYNPFRCPPTYPRQRPGRANRHTGVCRQILQLSPCHVLPCHMRL